MREAKKLLQFPESLPPIPDHLTPAGRDLFVGIVNEMADARVGMRPVDFVMVSLLAMQLEIIQRATLELSESTREEASALLRKIIAEQWDFSVASAKELMLSEEALKRLTGGIE